MNLKKKLEDIEKENKLLTNKLARIARLTEGYSSLGQSHVPATEILAIFRSKNLE